jgi:geranylgeranyl pyrophosphate synthase
MSEAVIIALITSLVPLIGTVLTVLFSAQKTDEKMRLQLAVFEAKLEELTREVRLHNGFAQRMPVVEEQVKQLKEQIKNLEDDSK